MTRLIDHLRLRRWLSAYLDEEVPEGMLVQLRSHIAACPTCQQDLVRIRAGRDWVIRGGDTAAVHTVHPWRWVAAAAMLVLAVIAVRWWQPPAVHAMDVNFYAAQFRSEGYCADPCTALDETTLDALRESPPLAMEYPDRLPRAIVLKRAIRYTALGYQGLGLMFGGAGKRIWIFEQPERLSLAVRDLPTAPINICGRECTRIECSQVRLLNWSKDGLSFVVATDLEQGDVEAIVASLRRLKS